MLAPLLLREPCTTFVLSAVSRLASTRASLSGVKSVVTEFFTNNGRSGIHSLPFFLLLDRQVLALILVVVIQYGSV